MHTNLLRTTIILGLLLTALPAEAATIQVWSLPIDGKQITVPAGEAAAALGLRMQGDCSGKQSIQSLTFVHEGTGALTDLRDIVFTDSAGKRYDATFKGFDDWSSTTTIRFLKPLEVASCAKVDLTATVSFATTANVGGTHTLILELATDVVPATAGTVVDGNAYPLRGATMTVTASKKATDVCNGGTAKARQECRKAKRTRH